MNTSSQATVLRTGTQASEYVDTANNPEDKMSEITGTPGFQCTGERTSSKSAVEDRGTKRSLMTSSTNANCVPHCSPELDLRLQKNYDKEAKKPKLSNNLPPSPSQDPCYNPNEEYITWGIITCLTKTISSLKKELEDLIQNVVVSKIESLERTVDNLRLKKCIIKELGAPVTHHEEPNTLRKVLGKERALMGIHVR